MRNLKKQISSALIILVMAFFFISCVNEKHDEAKSETETDKGAAVEKTSLP